MTLLERAISLVLASAGGGLALVGFGGRSVLAGLRPNKNPAATKYRLQIIGYSTLGTSAVALPSSFWWRTGDWLFGGLLLTTLSLTLFLCWTYRARFDLPGRSLIRGRRGGQRIALTFDDGPNGPSTEAILDVLKKHGARATFFCIGKQAAARPDLIHRMTREGHLVGSHSEDHQKLAWRARREIAHQIDGAQRSLVGAGAPRPTWFRAPHGFKSPLLHGMLQSRGMRLCAWSHELRDFEQPGVAVLVERALSGLSDGQIVLMHDGGGDRLETAAALDHILEECRQRGLTPVTVDEIATRVPR